jgi:uncharacterized protein (DUF433 family)
MIDPTHGTFQKRANMASPIQKSKHPHIGIVNAAGGKTAVVSGSKFPVRSVVNYVLKQGLSPEELVREFDYLTLAQVHDALSYYYDHREEIERELAENTERVQRSAAR